jgi:hypothetical protein
VIGSKRAITVRNVFALLDSTHLEEGQRPALAVQLALRPDLLTIADFFSRLQEKFLQRASVAVGTSDWTAFAALGRVHVWGFDVLASLLRLQPTPIGLFSCFPGKMEFPPGCLFCR